MALSEENKTWLLKNFRRHLVPIKQFYCFAILLMEGQAKREQIKIATHIANCIIDHISSPSFRFRLYAKIDSSPTCQKEYEDFRDLILNDILANSNKSQLLSNLKIY